MIRPIVLLAVAALVIAAALAIGTTSRSGGTATIEDRAQEIAAGLRCPVCQNLSVADSPSRLAGEMRAEIASRLRAGASGDDVRAYFVERYGDWVLLEPPRSGFNLIPWVLPMAALLAGLAGLVAFLRRRPRSDAATVPREEPT